MDLDTDSDDDITIPSASAVASQTGKPWFADFRKYMDAVDELPEDMSVVTWWGVGLPFIHSSARLTFVGLDKSSPFPLGLGIIRARLSRNRSRVRFG